MQIIHDGHEVALVSITGKSARDARRVAGAIPKGAEADAAVVRSIQLAQAFDAAAERVSMARRNADLTQYCSIRLE